VTGSAALRANNITTASGASVLSGPANLGFHPIRYLDSSPASVNRSQYFLRSSAEIPIVAIDSSSVAPPYDVLALL